MSATTTTRSRTRTRVFALLAGGLVLGLGATATLASWSDNEWVVGGATGTTPGIGTSAFEVEQNRGTGWGQFETANGGLLTFTGPNLTLSPGDSTFTQVSLRTTASAPASIGGTLQLLAGVQAAAPQPASSTALWNALQMKVVVSETLAAAATPTCDASRFTAGATYAVGTASTFGTLATAETGTHTLLPTAGNVFHYCYQITLPTGSADTLMGATVAPSWQFHSVSN